MFVRVEEVSFDEIPDSRIAVGFTKLSFPQQLNAETGEKRINLYGSPTNGVLRVSNVVGDMALYDLTDYRNHVLVPYTVQNNDLQAPVENDTEGHKFYLKDAQNFNHCRS